MQHTVYKKIYTITVYTVHDIELMSYTDIDFISLYIYFIQEIIVTKYCFY